MNQNQLLPPTERDDTAGLSDSERFRVLADFRRRHVLDVLEDADEPCGLDGLATAIEAREVRTADADDVRITLHHVHLPMLDDAGLVEYDPATGTVESATSPGR